MNIAGLITFSILSGITAGTLLIIKKMKICLILFFIASIMMVSVFSNSKNTSILAIWIIVGFAILTILYYASIRVIVHITMYKNIWFALWFIPIGIISVLDAIFMMLKYNSCIS